MTSPDAVTRSPSHPTPGWLRGAWILLPLAAAALVIGLTSRQAPLSRGTPPRLGSLPDFALMDSTRRPVTLAGLRGRPWVADFIFTRCGGVCPGMTARLARLRREVGPEVAFVSFTVDPAHDTPEVLARYAASFRAGEGWQFVTGPAPDVYALSVNGFKLTAEAVPSAAGFTSAQLSAGGAGGPGGPPATTLSAAEFTSAQLSNDAPFLHSSKFVLVDKAGGVRGYYDSGDESAVRALREDLVLVMAEVP